MNESPSKSVERNLLFAVEALRLDLIDSAQLIEACEDWATDSQFAMADLLVKRSWISPTQRARVDGALDQQLEAHSGDARAALGDAASVRLRDSMRIVKDEVVRRTLTDLPAPPDQVSVAPEQRPTTSHNRYDLTRQYSEGGLGRIWLARDVNLQREVILKELHPDRVASSEAQRRLLREAQITGQLEHPNIVPVYELGLRSEDDHPYYTMRFVRGQTMRAAIAAYHRRPVTTSEHSLTFRQLMTSFAGVCNAIAYAHSRGVIHRDLKPENVVLGAFGEVILLDWGLAKLADCPDADAEPVKLGSSDPSRTADGSVLGTPAYMAPELAAGDSDAVTTRTDIYGLGSVLFEILTGGPPHRGTDAAEVIRRITKVATPQARSVQKSAPPALDTICSVAMARNPKDRYATASELAEDVHRWLADEAVSVHRESVLAQVHRWTRRHRAATAAALVVAVSMAVGLANIWWQRDGAIAQELEMLGREAREETGRLSALVDILRQDVGYLADLHGTREILETPSGQRQTESKQLVAGVLTEFLRHRPNYIQARLLDRGGHEVVRVEREPSDLGQSTPTEPSTVDELELQDKGDYDYFTVASALPSGDAYLSKVELNREAGEIDPRRVPVIRASVPVHGEGGQLAGVVVINTDFRPLFEMLQSSMPGDRHGAREPTTNTRYFCVTDHEGYFLWNPEHPDHTFGFDVLPPASRDPDYMIQGAYPELDAFFSVAAPTSDVCVVSGTGADRRAVYLYRLQLDPRRPERALGMAVATPYRELAARARSRYGLPMYATLSFLVALVAILCWLIAYSRKRERRLGRISMLPVWGRMGGRGSRRKATAK